MCVEATRHLDIGADSQRELSNSKWCVTIPLTNLLKGQALSDERQQSIHCNAIDHLAIGTSFQRYKETVTSSWKCLRPIG